MDGKRWVRPDWPDPCWCQAPQPGLELNAAEQVEHASETENNKFYNLFRSYFEHLARASLSNVALTRSLGAASGPNTPYSPYLAHLQR